MVGFPGAVRRFFAENGFFLAAGLAFCFLVCIIPLSLLGVSTLGFVLSTEQAHDLPRPPTGEYGRRRRPTNGALKPPRCLCDAGCSKSDN